MGTPLGVGFISLLAVFTLHSGQMGTGFVYCSWRKAMRVHTPLRSDGNPNERRGTGSHSEVHTPLRSDGNDTVHITDTVYTLFTLHSGQMGT